MKKYILIILVLGTAWLAKAGAPLDNIGHIVCPNNDTLKSYNRERVGPSKLKFWFGGVYHQWTPLAVTLTVATPDAGAPQLQNTRIELAPVADGDWVMKCYFQAIGLYNSSEIAVTSLTIPAKSCLLDKTTLVVACQK